MLNQVNLSICFYGSHLLGLATLNLRKISNLTFCILIFLVFSILNNFFLTPIHESLAYYLEMVEVIVGYNAKLRYK